MQCISNDQQKKNVENVDFAVSLCQMELYYYYFLIFSFNMWFLFVSKMHFIFLLLFYFMPSLKIFKHLIINIKYYLTWKKKSKYFGVFIATSEFLMNFTGFLCLFFPLYHFLYYDLSQQTLCQFFFSLWKNYSIHKQK